MKRFNFGLALAAGSLLVGGLAHADFRPGRVRATQRSTFMNQVTEDGKNIRKNVGSFTANSMDGKGLVSFTLTVQEKRYCVVAPCPQPLITRTYKLTGKEKESQHQVHYTAVNDEDGTHIDVLQDSSTMTFFIDESRQADPSDTYRHFSGEYEYLMVTM